MKKILTISSIVAFILLLLTIVYSQEIIGINQEDELSIINHDTIKKNTQENKASKGLSASSKGLGISSASKGLSASSKNIGISSKAKVKVVPSEKIHVLIEFERNPTGKEKREFEKNGIKLLNYMPDNSWFASVSDIDEIEKTSNIRVINVVDDISDANKISFAVKNKNYVKNDDDTINLSVKLYDDVNLDDEISKIENYGDILDKFDSVNELKISVKEDKISDLADNDIVQWLHVSEKELTTHNDGVRQNIGVNLVQSSPYWLSGANVVAAEWDYGWADDAHEDLQGRVTIGDSASCGSGDSGICGVASHSTHVAGTMLGNGALSEANGGEALQWRGMAPTASLITYEWWDTITELNDEHDSAINIYDASLSQNSWGYQYNGCGSDCSGSYDSFSAQLDAIVRGLKGKKITQVWSAGNKRPYCDDGEYDCIGLPATAKNVITVGATNSDDDSITFFSSFGPTNDGRLKPEVTTPGCEADRNDNTITGSIWSTLSVDTYGGYCGTSMAAPAASGVIALMYEEFANNNIYPLPSTIKAILTHTALDLGTAGPDYSFGYGRIEAQAAIELIKNDARNSVIVEDQIANQALTHQYQLEVIDQEELKLTLVWDDYQGTANANKDLVNDLDLILIAPDLTEYLPWLLDPSNPSNAATNGIDNVNNIEQVVVDPSPGTWTVRVTGSLVPQAPQTYSLISSNSLSKLEFGSLQPYLINPTTNMDVSKDKFFTFSSGVKCLNGDCGDIKAILDPIDTVGGFNRAWSGTNRGRGNNWFVEDDTVLTEIEMNLDISTSTSLNWYVYENADATGTFTKIHESETTSGTGMQFYSSGPIEVQLEAQKYYLIGVWWGSDAVVYGRSLDTVPFDVSFGRLQSGIPGSPYSSMPPDTWYFWFTGFSPYHSRLTTNPEKTAISTTIGDTPFYTTSNNPQTSDNLGCLQDMKDGDVCIQTWQVNSTGGIGKTFKFFTSYESTSHSSTVASNKTETIEITIVEPSESNLISVTLLGYPIDFNSLDPNTIKSSAEGNSMDSYVIQIDPISTVNVDIFQKGDDFTSSSSTIGIENVVYDDDKTLEGSPDITNPETVLSNDYATEPYYSNIPPGENKNFYYWIDIPEAQQPGDYDANIFIKAVETGSLP